LVRDQFGHDAVLLRSEWDIQILQRENPKLLFEAIYVAKFQQETNDQQTLAE